VNTRNVAPSCLPLLQKLDLSVTQDIFKSVKGHRTGGQFRHRHPELRNLLNSNWGVGQRVIPQQPS
jgi:hypothetical protein